MFNHIYPIDIPSPEISKSHKIVHQPWYEITNSTLNILNFYLLNLN